MDSKTSRKHDSPLTFEDDEEIESPDDDSGDDNDESEHSEEEEEETAEQMRKRVAKEYLASMSGGGDETVDVSERLQKDRLLQQGKYFRNIASSTELLSGESDLSLRYLSGHKLAVTCVSLSSDETTIYSGSKDNSVIKWDTETGSRQILKPHWSRRTHGSQQALEGEILAVSCSTDNRYVVSGGRDHMIRVYDARMNSAEIKVFQGHRDAVTCLSFRRDTYSLFSGSLDRCLKHWDLNEMGYIETMFGHQDGVYAVDCWTKDRPVSSSSDRSIRLWKVADESHLVFRGHKSGADAVQLLTEDSFVSGGQDGSLFLWRDIQKKPIATVATAHGLENSLSPRWICSLASVKMSDLAVSGSHDGFLRFWNANAFTRDLRETLAYPMEGFINAISASPRLVVAGVGNEHRLGRWWKLKGDLNRVAVLRLPQAAGDGAGAAEESYDSSGPSDNEASDDDV